MYQTLEGLFEGRVGADLALTVAALAAIILGEQMTAALVVFIALCGESIEGYTLDRCSRRFGEFSVCVRPLRMWFGMDASSTYPSRMFASAKP